MRLVTLCVERAWIVVTLAVILGAAITHYVVAHFAMTTDTYALLSPKLAWRIRETAFNVAFPQDAANVVVVIDAQTPELGEEAAAELAAHLSAQPGLFRSVERPDGGPFWAKNRLLFASTEDVKAVTAQLLKAQPFLGPMASDPSLRGLASALSLAIEGVTGGQASLQDLRTPIRTLADALQGLGANNPVAFSWSSLISGHQPDPRELRHILLVDPKLDFTQLEPGKLAIDAIRATASRLQLDSAHGVRVRLTGPVALQDEEFATLTQRAGLIACLASGAMILMLWFALRSLRLIASILATTLLGLMIATALGLAVFHRFNVISVAFIPLFVGLGIDIGIQFSVRYRAERRATQDVRAALVATGHEMGKSLTLAATAIGVGFLAFGPTAYYGVSQLGVIAGLGIFTALALNLTVLPALIGLTRAPGAPDRPTSVRVTIIDKYVLRHRRRVLGTGVTAAVICAALLPLVRFDFNPRHLRSTEAESVATLLDLMRDPEESPNTLEVIRSNLDAANQVAARFRSDPAVGSAHTLSSFIPAEQSEKIALIADAANLLDLTLNPLEVAAAPSDLQVTDSLNRIAAKLRRASIDHAMDSDTGRLADQFSELAQASPAARAKAAQMLLPGFMTVLDQVRQLLQPRPITIGTLPPEIVRKWLTSDWRARVSISARGDSNDNAVLSRFVASAVKMAPDVTGTAISLEACGRAVVDAFIEAGALSFVAITLLLLVSLRRVRDVAITMAPIVLTGLLTMGTCVLIRQPLNFANIIALPLLFGIGVAFHIYFVMSWRSGGSHLLTSSLARGVFFSALATGMGFGSLWASSHPGTASMGELLMISLVWTLASALLFQPALMGRSPMQTAHPLSHERITELAQVRYQDRGSSGGQRSREV
ncbi:MAG: hopanoid biosynthesis-associated transporter HpnN [Gammaproteobacteria bacterium]|nr:hopanoid biosynthesis-associated transporter HpnN [Gammaproteobacteria bacterium]